MLVCWKCGASLASLSLPLTRRDVCKQCNADLHVCKLCEFYDISKAKHCKEVIAEEVRDKDRSNFCDYFKPKANAHSNKQQSDAERAKSELEALFGRK
jgi:excinuclease UvrABC nuclease subunit